MIGVKDAGKRVKRVIVVMEGFEVMVVQCKSHLQQYEYRRCKKEQSASCRASLHIVTLQSRPAAARCVTLPGKSHNLFGYTLRAFRIAIKLNTVYSLGMAVVWEGVYKQ